MIDTPSIKKLFAEYEKAFNQLDIASQVDHFAPAFLSAGPRGVIASSREEFRKLASQMRDFYASAGQESAQLINAKEIPISDDYSLVRTHWGAKFKKTGDRLIEFDVSYIVQKSDPPKIILFITHEDEEKVMKELGLLSTG